LYLGSERKSRTEKACFYCGNGRAEELRCLSLAKLLKITKDQHVLIPCSKSYYSAANCLGYFNSNKRLVRRFAMRIDGIEIAQRLTERPTLLSAI
jgi:hypothetical protein